MNENKTTNQQMSKPVGGWGVLVGGIDRSMHKRTGNMDTTGKAFREVKVMSLSSGMAWEAGVLEKKTIRNYSTQHVPCKNSVFFCLGEFPERT